MGQSRIEGMIEGRPEWCISRQRTWVCLLLSLFIGTAELHPNTLERLRTLQNLLLKKVFKLDPDTTELLGSDAEQ